ncbi:Craniofacial development protein 2 [Holothuria leucospilota]|uniref:Craniofacial development protein 2 n=1 Tax=Holothuria leucospilota TaxID=206669 RepID=A0A9Q1C9A4_HOLLE|nr:Craniofacial development protein 2 [Holothuria leucospilota]
MKLKLGTCNVRILLDNSRKDRPTCRTAFVAREFTRYHVGIAALSETRFADRGELTEIDCGFTFFWSGRLSTKKRETGGGFVVRSHIVKKLAKLPKGVNEFLMTLLLPLGKKNAFIISAFAPTMTNPDDVKDQFYEELETIITRVPQTDKLILLGDFNARVASDHRVWENVIGKHGIGKCNSNGLLLVKTCATHDLVITYTMFRLPTHKRYPGCTLAPSTGTYRLCHHQEE